MDVSERKTTTRQRTKTNLKERNKRKRERDIWSRKRENDIKKNGWKSQRKKERYDLGGEIMRKKVKEYKKGEKEE